jgi:hypothetical protein
LIKAAPVLPLAWAVANNQLTIGQAQISMEDLEGNHAIIMGQTNKMGPRVAGDFASDDYVHALLEFRRYGGRIYRLNASSAALHAAMERGLFEDSLAKVR